MYYYRYYGGWGGWENDADDKTRKTYVLGKLMTRQMWAGQQVHDGIKKMLESIQAGIKSVDLQGIMDEIMEIMRTEFKDSKKGRYLREPKTCALYEHEYNLQLPKTEWENTANNAKDCLKNFFNSEVFQFICDIPDNQWLEVEKLSTFHLEGYRIFVKLDFALKNDEKITIYDWKTGRLGDEANQLQSSCYGLYAVNTLGASPQNVRVLEFYVSSNELREYEFGNREVELITQYIQSSIDSMISLLDDRETNSASEERFSLTEDRRSCTYCNFRKVCSRFSKN